MSAEQVKISTSKITYPAVLREKLRFSILTLVFQEWLWLLTGWNNIQSLDGALWSVKAIVTWTLKTFLGEGAFKSILLAIRSHLISLCVHTYIIYPAVISFISVLKRFIFQTFTYYTFISITILIFFSPWKPMCILHVKCPFKIWRA